MKTTCTCENPKDLVADILHTALPHTFQEKLAELNLTDQHLTALLQHFAAMLKADITWIDLEIEELRQDQDEKRDRLASVETLLS